MTINFIDQSHGEDTLVIHNDTKAKQQVPCRASLVNSRNYPAQRAYNPLQFNEYRH